MSSLFDIFQNIPVIKKASGQQSHKQQQLTTLGELARTNDYLLIYILSSTVPPNPAFLQALQKLLSRKSQSASIKRKDSSNSPAKLKRIFGIGKKDKESETVTASSSSNVKTEIATIVVDIELMGHNESNLSFIVEHGFFFLCPDGYLSKSRLLRALNFVNNSSLYVIDCSQQRVISQAYRIIMDDPDGSLFPWAVPSPAELFKGDLLQNSPSNESFVNVDFSTLADGVKGLFFGAKWCPPSRQMCKQLCEIYPKIKEKHPEFEIIFCSSDRSEESFREHFKTMPWLALPYGKEKSISKAFDVQGIPTFILLNQDCSIISRNGRNVVLADPQGYPWERKALYELTEFTAHRLSEMPSLVLFTEGSPEDTDFSLQLLNSCTESIHSKQSSNVDPLQIFYTGEDPICDYVLESLGQDQAELPLLIICDVMAGHLAICEEPDVSEQVLLQFVDNYRNGRAKVQPIPSPEQKQSRTVAGIPAEVLQQLVLQQQQPSQLHQSGYVQSA